MLEKEYIKEVRKLLENFDNYNGYEIAKTDKMGKKRIRGKMVDSDIMAKERFDRVVITFELKDKRLIEKFLDLIEHDRFKIARYPFATIGCEESLIEINVED